ncbi:MAG TPA: MarR family transcriptional regulator [Longimicrobiaceae bacterium]|jgi:DNA-binding MarR family transcriptional regulator
MKERTMDAAPLPVSAEQRVAVALARVVSRGLYQAEQLIKPHGLTATQYNVLRILNGAGPEGLCGTEIGSRLVSPVPDMTRLLDRMAEAGLLVRERDPEHRRFVRARLTEAGRAKLLETTPVLDAMHREQFRRLSPEQLATLRSLLDLLADPEAGTTG